MNDIESYAGTTTGNHIFFGRRKTTKKLVTYSYIIPSGTKLPDMLRKIHGPSDVIVKVSGDGDIVSLCYKEEYE